MHNTKETEEPNPLTEMWCGIGFIVFFMAIIFAVTKVWSQVSEFLAKLEQFIY